MAKKRRHISRKSGKKVRVAFRRNRAKPARENDWTRQFDDNELTEDTPLDESVVAKGALSRKRTIIDEDPAKRSDWSTGVVVAMRGLFAEVDSNDRVWPCTVRRVLRTRLIGERQSVTVGDRVHFSIESDEEGILREGVIEAVEPRHGVLLRVAGRRVHTMVANVDQVIIVASCGTPTFKPHLIDRYIVAAHHGEVTPIVCLNKIDLDDGTTAQDQLQQFADLGYRTLATSAVTRAGIDELRGLLAGKCSAIAGQSGVGKSSLLNAVHPGLNLRTGEVNEETRKGRHVTTTALLIKVSGGGYVVDTPGVKSFDLSAVPVEEIEAYFVELAPHIPHCKYADCTHTHETDCAVKTAVDNGQVTPERYASYVRMLTERGGG